MATRKTCSTEHARPPIDVRMFASSASCIWLRNRSFILLIVCLISLFQPSRFPHPQLAMVFGASGLIAASAARVSFFLNKSFDLVSAIIKQLAGEEKEE